ncbi:MAG TPA: asparagine synthase (glutamine-hydrolyzing) [Caulobacteraceae bacterium]
MCGVNGAWAYRASAPAPDRAELLRVRDAMAPRGPDGVGEWWSEHRRCGFGHQRLAIQDPTPRANQPMASADDRLVITFNGQIYNFPALKADLETRGAQFRTTCDTEALLHLYALDGPDMVRRLRGMFAFAIWDAAKEGLFLARDPYGIKPLYVSDDGATFRFASQVKALLAGGAVAREPEPAGVAGFHLFGHVPDPFTLYRDIRALPAGCSQWVDAAGAEAPKPFVSIPAILAQGAAEPAPAVELAERVRAAVSASVAAHMLSDVEVGCFLSAGVDSGAMLGLMRQASNGSLRAITLAFEEFRGSGEDEAPLAGKVAAHYGCRHEVRWVARSEFETDLEAIFAAMDQPSIDGVNTWFVAKAARDAGLKVAISGLGGDELLAGYPSFVDLPRWRRRYGPLAAAGLGGVARRVLSAAAPGLLRDRPKAAGMLEHAGSWTGAYLLRRGLFLPHELPALIGTDLAREGLKRLQLTPMLEAAITPDPGSDMGRVCALESLHYMKNQLLRDADWAGMAHGVEIRPPLVDIELLRALAPSVATLQPGAGKAALAAAPLQPLPDEIVSRAKTGFFVPTGAWMAEAAAGAMGVRAPPSKGLASRQWARKVFGALSQTTSRAAAPAAAAA